MKLLKLVRYVDLWRLPFLRCFTSSLFYDHLVPFLAFVLFADDLELSYSHSESLCAMCKGMRI